MEDVAILIVEDDELVRSFLSRALSGLGGEIDAYATGKDALGAVARRRYGAILLDGLLPDVHGLELAKQLVRHRNAAGSGICFVSGSLRHPRAMRDGVSALSKPLRLRELLDAVGLLIAWSAGGGAPLEARLAALDLLGADLLVT